MVVVVLGLAASMGLLDSSANLVKRAHDGEVKSAFHELIELNLEPLPLTGDSYDPALERLDMQRRFAAMKQRYGSHLLAAIDEFIDAQDFSTLFQHFISEALPLFRIQGWPLLQKLLEKSKESEPALFGFTDQSLQRVVSASNVLGCRLFETIVDHLRENFDSWKSYDSMAKEMALHCAGGAAFLIDRIKQKREVMISFLSELIKSSPTPEGRRFVAESLAQGLLSPDLLISTLSESYQNSFRIEWLTLNEVQRGILSRLRGRAPWELTLNALVLALDGGFLPEDANHFLEENLSRTPLESRIWVLTRWLQLSRYRRNWPQREEVAFRLGSETLEDCDRAEATIFSELVANEALMISFADELRILAHEQTRFLPVLVKSSTEVNPAIALLSLIDSVASSSSGAGTSLSYADLFRTTLRMNDESQLHLVLRRFAAKIRDGDIAEELKTEVRQDIANLFLETPDSRTYVMEDLVDFVRPIYADRKVLRRILTDSQINIRRRGGELLKRSVVALKEDEGFYFQLKEGLLMHENLGPGIRLELTDLFVSLDDTMKAQSLIKNDCDYEEAPPPVETRNPHLAAF